MAEALGVAASGIAVIQVAMVVGQSVIKLRDLWKEVKDVPNSITDLMRQVELMNRSLGVMERNLQAAQAINSCEDVIGPALEYARNARDEFVALVDELSHEINAVRKRKRMMARLRVVLGQSQLSRCESRLRGAVQLLGFAQQASMFAMSARLPDLVAAKMMSIKEERKETSGFVISDTEEVNEVDCSNASEAELEPPEHNGQIEQPPAYCSHETYSPELLARSTPKTVCKVRLRSPAWWADRAWEFELARAMSGWQAYIRTYNIISHRSDISMALFHSESTSKIISLFNSGLASPLDVDVEGYSILDKTISGDYDLSFVKYLYSLGARPGRGWRTLRSVPHEDASLYRYALALGYRAQRDSEMVNPLTCCVALANAATTGFFNAVLQIVGPDYFYGIPFRVRFIFYWWNMTHHPSFSWRTLPCYFEIRTSHDDRCSPEQLFLEREFTTQRRCSREAALRNVEPDPTTITSCQHCANVKSGMWESFWSAFGRDAAAQPSFREEGILVQGGTALLCHVLRNAQCPGFCRKARRHLWNFIQTHWLQVLQDSGIDMRTYLSSVEAFYWTDENLRSAPADFFAPFGPVEESYGPREHPGFAPPLTGLSYDHRTQRLKMVWYDDTHPHPEYAGDFWSMIEGIDEDEGSSSRIPGAWVD